MRQISDLSEIDAINCASDDEAVRIHNLTEVYWSPPDFGEEASSLDPFTEQFRASAAARLEEITGRLSYEAARDEKAPYLPDEDGEAVVPGHYTIGDSAWAGDFIQAHGAVMKALAMRSGQRILEYGPGDGQIILHLARMGCRVTAVDIEAKYLSRIQSQAAAFRVDITTINGVFGDSEAGVLYDRILFFEAFHHAIDHHALVSKLRQMLVPGGFVVLAGEPVLEHDNYYRPTLPYAWGPRLDGLSLRVMRTYGWCELGFAREYFTELWMRAGFILTFLKDATTGRGSAYIATPRRDLAVDVTGPCLLEAWGFADCWHPSEGSIRWSKTSRCAIPLDESFAWSQVVVTLQNILPVETRMQVTSGVYAADFPLAPGELKRIVIPSEKARGRIAFTFPVNKPCDLHVGSPDTRDLGFALTGMFYEE